MVTRSAATMPAARKLIPGSDSSVGGSDSSAGGSDSSLPAARRAAGTPIVVATDAGNVPWYARLWIVSRVAGREALDTSAGARAVCQS